MTFKYSRNKRSRKAAPGNATEAEELRAQNAAENAERRAKLATLRQQVTDLQKLKPKLQQEFEGQPQVPGSEIDKRIGYILMDIEKLEIELITQE